MNQEKMIETIQELRTSVEVLKTCQKNIKDSMTEQANTQKWILRALVAYGIVSVVERAVFG